MLLESFNTVKNVLKSINDGTLKKTLPESKYEEINQINNEINEISEKIEINFSKLKSEKNKLDYILNNINDGLFAVDNVFNIVLINSRAKQIFESTGNVIGQKLSYLTFDKKLTESIKSCVETQQSALFEYELKGFVYLVTVKGLIDTDAQIKSANLCVVIFSDITESRKNQNLREEFFANASHELKTPLTAIKGFNELVYIHNNDEKLEKYISRITKETDRMLSLISDMLKLSELENTRITDTVNVDLKRTAEEVRESLSTIISEKNVEVKINGNGSVNAENTHIYELVKNLIENAVKYNRDKGNVNVLIAEEKDNVVFTVSDNGIGISPQDHTRIFERFYRVEKSRSRQNGGTGLGLSIVKHICNLYGAELSLKSRPGVGTEIKAVFKKLLSNTNFN